MVESLPTLGPNQVGRVGSVSYSLNGGRMITMASNNIAVWGRSQNGSFSPLQPNLLAPDGLSAAEMSPDGLRIAAAGGNSSSIYIWSARPNNNRFELLQTIQVTAKPYSFSVTCLSFSSDNNRLVAGFSDGDIVLWVLNSGGLYDNRATFKGHQSSVSSIRDRFSKMVSAGSLDKTIAVWAYNALLSNYTRMQTIPALESVFCADFSEDEGMVAAGLQSGSFQVYALAPDGKYNPSQRVADAQTNGVRAIAIASDSAKIATGGSDTKTSLWQLRSGKFELAGLVADSASALDFDRSLQLGVGLSSSPAAQTKLYNIGTLSNPSTSIINLGPIAATGATGGVLSAGTAGTTATGGRFITGTTTTITQTAPQEFIKIVSVNDVDKGCVDGFYREKGNCVRNCSLVTWSLGPDERGGCRCALGYSYNGRECLLNSKTQFQIIEINGLPCNTLGASKNESDPDNCICKEGMTWSRVSQICVRKCELVKNAAGNNPSSLSICLCVNGYQWGPSETCEKICG